MPYFVSAQVSPRSKGGDESRPQAVEIIPSYAQYRNAHESLRFGTMKAPDYARFPGTGFDISFWFALLSPLIGLLMGLLALWLFGAMTQ